MKTNNTIYKIKTAAPSLGGKASNLLLLEEMNLNVPKWMVIPSEVMSDSISTGLTEEQLKTAVKTLSVPYGVLAEIQNHFGTDFKTTKYAVRSSALDEDGTELSFAGQYVTKLNVGYKGLAAAIKAVWESVVSEHVLTYKNKFDKDFQGIAVVIQEMVRPDVSGVAFGQDPVSGCTQTKVISSVFGLGEGLVSGELKADTYTLKQNGIKTQLAEKQKTVQASGGQDGVELKEISAEQKNMSSLTEDQLMELGDLLDRLNDKTGVPQDVEFAYADGHLYVLQTRPITTVQKNTDRLIWDNSNIIESYPGVTTPLTYSFIDKMYAAVYKQLVGLMGVGEKTIAKHNAVFENTLGLVRGRVYYNLISWHKMLAMAPGYSINAGFMDTMMGVKEKFELGEEFRMSKSMAWFRIIKMIIKMIWLQVTLPSQRRKFQVSLEQKLTHYNGMDYTAMSSGELVNTYSVFETTLLKEWKVPLVNDFFSMIWFGLLKKQTKELMPAEVNIHNDLLCGSEDIISVQPIHRTMELAGLIREDAQAEALFLTATPEVIWKALGMETNNPIKQKIDVYLNDFGERCMGELKLETISYTQKPELFMQVLKSYVVGGTRMSPGNSINIELRAVADEKMESALKGQYFKRLWFKMVLRQARDLVSNRENLRYERTRAFGVVRKIMTALGVRMFQEKRLTDSRDIFYLKLEEVLELNKLDGGEVMNLVQKRKAEFAAYQEQADPQERFQTQGYNFDDASIYSEELLEPISGDLEGIGCCPGQIKAKVQVIMDPTSIGSLNGDILVTRSTDPGWVTLFPSASGIIVEKGSLLSHSAIVCREMGIPCIVCVDGLLRTLKTGDEILMDGGTGIIKILNDKL